MQASDVRFLATRHFDLAATMESGQFFRYEPRGQGYRLVIRDHVLEVRQDGDRLFYRGADEPFIRRLFALDQDPRPILRRLARHAWFRPALHVARGLRILRQDLWECLLGFVCSTVSNIPRIRRNMHDLARLYGRPVGHRELVAHSLPRPGMILDDARLAQAKLGFRGQRLLELQRRVDESWLSTLVGLPEADQRRWLMSLPGVGEKVADCVLLFALGRGRAFPIDVWVRRAVRGMAPRGAKTYDRIRAWAVSTFGEDAGFAQQALFVWARNGGLDGHAPKRTSRIRSAARPSP